MNNRDKLKQYKEDYNLTRQQMADLVLTPLSTMNNWLNPETSKSSRSCPDSIIELLRIKLECNIKCPEKD